MTGLEAAQKFKVEINKLDRSSYIDIRLEKILHYLNKAALFLVKKKYRGIDSGPGRLEIMHPVLDDLKNLIKESSTTGLEETGLTEIAFENDHLYFIACNIQTASSECPTPDWHEGRYVKPERVYKELESPFTESKLDSPMITVVGDKLVIYHSAFDVGAVTVKYLSTPAEITSDAEIALSFENEIIDTAVSMALENVESQRIKTQPQVNVANISE